MQVDYRGCVEREQLTEREPSNHRVAERPAQFGAGAMADCQRNCCEKRRDRRHQYRA